MVPPAADDLNEERQRRETMPMEANPMRQMGSTQTVHNAAFLRDTDLDATGERDEADTDGYLNVGAAAGVQHSPKQGVGTINRRIAHAADANDPPPSYEEIDRGNGQPNASGDDGTQPCSAVSLGAQNLYEAGAGANGLESGRRHDEEEDESYSKPNQGYEVPSSLARRDYDAPGAAPERPARRTDTTIDAEHGVGVDDHHDELDAENGAANSAAAGPEYATPSSVDYELASAATAPAEDEDDTYDNVGALPQPHLMLGLTREGVIDALETIGFPYKYKFVQAQEAEKSQAASGRFELQPEQRDSPFDVAHRNSDFVATYTRPKGPSRGPGAGLDWVAEEGHGEFNDSLDNDSSSTGYDVVEATKKYLRDSGHGDESLCEVLQMENNPNVGRADVFLSHVQSAHVGEMLGTMKAANDAFKECGGNTKYWIDFFTLRQCEESAFKPEEMVRVISDIGVTVVELDGAFVGDVDLGDGKGVAVTAKPCTYLSRTFCIFEVYATIKEHGSVLCVPKSIVGLEWDHHRWAALLALGEKVKTIDCATAKSRDEADKDKIDAYVNGSINGGFQRLNTEVRQAILKGADRCRPDLFGEKYRQTDTAQTDLRPQWESILRKSGVQPIPAELYAQMDPVNSDAAGGVQARSPYVTPTPKARGAGFCAVELRAGNTPTAPHVFVRRHLTRAQSTGRPLVHARTADTNYHLHRLAFLAGTTVWKPSSAGMMPGARGSMHTRETQARTTPSTAARRRVPTHAAAKCCTRLVVCAAG